MNYDVCLQDNKNIAGITVSDSNLRVDDIGIYFLDNKDQIFMFIPHHALVYVKQNKSKELS